jgi:putative DNA primase/helicase
MSANSNSARRLTHLKREDMDRPGAIGLWLSSQGFWPTVVAAGEERPVNKWWGTERLYHDEQVKLRKQFPGSGVGLCLGPGRGPDDCWLAVLECNGVNGQEFLALLLGSEIRTLGWSSCRGPHQLFDVDGERLLRLLRAAGAREGKGHESGVYKLDFLPGLIFRIGGYKRDAVVKLQVVCPPTPDTDGKKREWKGAWILAQLPETAYTYLERLVADRARLKREVSGTVSPRDANGPPTPETINAYGRAALDRESHDVAIAQEGSRNDTLNRAAFSLGQLVGAGELDRAEVERRLTDAARQCGLSDAEIVATIASGMNAGEAHSRELQGMATERAAVPSDSAKKGTVCEEDDDPHRLARLHLAQTRHNQENTLLFHRGEWFQWNAGAYRRISDADLQSDLVRTIKAEFDRLNIEAQDSARNKKKNNGDDSKTGPPKALRVTRNVVTNAALALQSMVHVPSNIEPPAWLDGSCPVPPHELLPMRNGLVNLSRAADIHPLLSSSEMTPDQSGVILQPTPQFFCTHALDFDYDADAPPPIQWLRFLDSIWPDDIDCIRTLQEWFGYCLISDTRQQKILSLLGPKRAGKDTIGRVLTRIVGPENIAGPTLASLLTNFGLEPLLGKPVAIISDARISGRSDSTVIVERLLAISGEASITVDRKNKPAWTGRLPTRIVLISNELPRLTDASGALASRLIILRLTRSFYGKEDQELFNRIVPELPGILLWAIEGWHRLRMRGHVLQPASGADLVESLEDLSSPVLAFVKEKCELGPAKKVAIQVLYRAYCEWCHAVGRKEPGTVQSFGRDLHAACPGVTTYKTTRRKVDLRLFRGITLKLELTFPRKFDYSALLRGVSHCTRCEKKSRE